MALVYQSVGSSSIPTPFSYVLQDGNKISVESPEDVKNLVVPPSLFVGSMEDLESSWMWIQSLCSKSSTVFTFVVPSYLHVFVYEFIRNLSTQCYTVFCAHFSFVRFTVVSCAVGSAKYSQKRRFEIYICLHKTLVVLASHPKLVFGECGTAFALSLGSLVTSSSSSRGTQALNVCVSASTQNKYTSHIPECVL